MITEAKPNQRPFTMLVQHVVSAQGEQSAGQIQGMLHLTGCLPQLRQGLDVTKGHVPLLASLLAGINCMDNFGNGQVHDAGTSPLP